MSLSQNRPHRFINLATGGIPHAAAAPNAVGTEKLLFLDQQRCSCARHGLGCLSGAQNTKRQEWERLSLSSLVAMRNN